MNTTHSDALVFFGATGDLAYKKIFPSLQAMVKRGQLDVPVIGVAKAGWTLDQLRARRATASRSTAGSTRRRSTSCPACCATSTATTPTRRRSRRSAGSSAARSGRRTTSRSRRRCSARSSSNSRRPAARRVRASSSRSRSATTSPRRSAAQRDPAAARSTRARSSASTTTSASGRSTTCCSSASPTRSSSRSGTATTSRACRSPWRRTSASRAAAAFYDADRRDPRRRAEPPVPGAVPTSRWSRRSRTRQRVDARREGEGAEGDRAARCRATSCAGSSAAITQEPGVAPDSTDGDVRGAAAATSIRWRWQGVPFYIRAGKYLPVTCTEVARPLAPAADGLSEPATAPEPPALPDQSRRARSRSAMTVMDDDDEDARPAAPSCWRSRHPAPTRWMPTSACWATRWQGDATLFAREDYVEEAWRIVDPVLKAGTPVYDIRAADVGTERSAISRSHRPAAGTIRA